MTAFSYQLQFHGESLDLFKSKSKHSSEVDLINEMKNTLDAQRLHLVEIQLQLLFDKFETKNHESKFWHDNLKTLLAHGFDIINSSNNEKLVKSFEPLTFSLFAETNQNTIHFGSFYKEDNQSAATQFIKFCKVTEYPPGINQHIILEIIMNDGGSLVANEGGLTTLLIKRNPVSDTISGSDEVIKFLSVPVKQETE